MGNIFLMMMFCNRRLYTPFVYTLFIYIRAIWRSCARFEKALEKSEGLQA